PYTTLFRSAGGLHAVHAVVQRGGQVVDVIAVERGDERLVQPPHDRVRAVVGVVLGLLELLRERGPLGRRGADQLGEQVRPGDQVTGRGGQQVEERHVAWGQAETHSRLREGWEANSNRLEHSGRLWSARDVTWPPRGATWGERTPGRPAPDGAKAARSGRCWSPGLARPGVAAQCTSQIWVLQHAGTGVSRWTGIRRGSPRRAEVRRPGPRLRVARPVCALPAGRTGTRRCALCRSAGRAPDRAWRAAVGRA